MAAFSSIKITFRSSFATTFAPFAEYGCVVDVVPVFYKSSTYFWMDSWHWSLQWNMVLVKYKLLVIDWACSAQEYCHGTTRAHWWRHCWGTQHEVYNLLGLNLVSEMLSNEPGSVSGSKLVRLDVVRFPCLNRQGVTKSRAKKMGLWSYPIPGGQMMTLIELSMRMSKTAPAKTCTIHTDWKKCSIFQEEKNEDLT